MEKMKNRRLYPILGDSFEDLRIHSQTLGGNDSNMEHTETTVPQMAGGGVERSVKPVEVALRKTWGSLTGIYYDEDSC